MDRVLTNNEHRGIAAPSPWVARFVPLIRRGGRVLDLAAGNGRHARHLAALGYTVTAVDRDISGLHDFGGEAVALDLEDGRPWALGGDWDGIVVANYLHRPLLPSIAASLATDGMVIYETFAAGNERFGKPSNPDFLLRPGELLAAFSQLHIIAFEEGEVRDPRPAVVQRIAATRGALRPIP
jgi:SAM-dependent methyltransferase